MEKERGPTQPPPVCLLGMGHTETRHNPLTLGVDIQRQLHQLVLVVVIEKVVEEFELVLLLKLW